MYLRWTRYRRPDRRRRQRWIRYLR